MKQLYLVVVILISLLIMPGFMSKGFSDSREINLPSPRKKGDVSLEETLNKRQSTREYTAELLSLEEVSQILWASYGINKWSKLTVPSAGALYPLKIYLAAGAVEGMPPGLYRYNYKKQSLTQISSQDKRALLSEAALGQRWIKDAPAAVIICADYKITTSRYGSRGIRYVDIEVGHVGENIYLQATALGIGTVAIGAFSDEGVKNILGVKEDPVYIMPLGRKK